MSDRQIPAPTGPCRHCGGPSWGGDDRGPVHRCCALAEQDGRTCTSGQVCRDGAIRKAN